MSANNGTAKFDKADADALLSCIEKIKKIIGEQKNKDIKELSDMTDELYTIIFEGRQNGYFDEKALKKMIDNHSPKPSQFDWALKACTDDNDFKKAFELLYDEYQNNPDSPVSMALGDMYYYGIGTKKNYAKASRYYQEAINNHCTKASFADSLGTEYYNRGNSFLKGIGCPVDIPKAIENFELAFKYGSIYAGLVLADMYYEGKEVTKDVKKALNYWKKAAVQGSLDKKHRPNFDKQNTATAYNNLGYAYHEMGTQDAILAIEFFKKATEFGSADAYANLGHCYATGYGVEKDQDAADRMYFMGLNLGSKVAYDYLKSRGKLSTKKK